MIQGVQGQETAGWTQGPEWPCLDSSCLCFPDLPCMVLNIPGQQGALPGLSKHK